MLTKEGTTSYREVVEKLESNLTKFNLLTTQEQDILSGALSKSKSNVTRLTPSGLWHAMHCQVLETERRYRLAEDYADRLIQLEESAAEKACEVKVIVIIVEQERAHSNAQ